MNGATRIVASRSRGDAIERADMIPGTAHAYDESRATKQRPCRPASPMTRSTTKAARAMYPTSSRKWISAKRITSWGTKISTAPTPAMIPSTARSASTPAGSVSRTNRPRAPNAPSIASIVGPAHAKMLWNSSTITTANTNVPASGCSSTRSTASDRESGGVAAAPISRATASTQAKRSCGSPEGGRTAGLDQSAGCSSKARSSATPMPRLPTTPSTGMPRMRESLSRSSRTPRARTSSIMVTTSAVGRPDWSSSATSPRPRARVVPSATISVASGTASPGRSPLSTRPTTCSSGVSPSRL